MALLEYKDFSGGMVTDINPLNVPLNTMANLENVDVWAEIGVVQPINNLAIKTAFPASQVYDHHIIFPAHGDKDYALIMMSNGRIYSYDGTSFVLINSVGADQQAGAKMVYAGDRVFVFYRNSTGSTIFRRVITYDYSGLSFSIADGEVSERFVIDSSDEINNGFTGNEDHAFQCKITSIIEGGLSETKGREVVGNHLEGADNYIILTRDADFDEANVYQSYRNIDQNEQTFLTPQFFTNIKGGSDKSYVPLMSGFWARGDATLTGEAALATDILKVYYDNFAVPQNTIMFLAHVLELHTSATASYINTTHKIRFNGVEYTINTITKDTTNKVFLLDFNGVTLPEDIIVAYPEPPVNSGYGGKVLEVELTWISNKFIFPVQVRTRNILGIQIDEMRPETDFLNGTGDRIAYAKNFLFTSNPYFDDTFGVGDTEDKKGFLCWSFIDGLGQKDFLTMPNTNLIGIHSTAAEFVDLISFRDQILLFHKNGLARIIIRGGLPLIYDSEEHGIDDQNNFYVDDFNIFIYSNGKIKKGLFRREFLQEGNLKFAELSRGIATLVDPSGTPDIRFGWDAEKRLLYCHDDDSDWADDLICSLRNGDDKPVWVKYSSINKVDVYGSFELAGAPLFIVNDSGNWKIYDNTGSKVQDCVMESHDFYTKLGEDFLQKVEVAYQGTSVTANLVITLDGSTAHTLTLSNTATPIVKEFPLNRNNETRFSRMSWRLSGNFSSDFKLFGVFFNRDSYGREVLKGY